MTFQVLEQFIIILAATVTASLISHRLRLPAILNYLVVGFVVGPQVTGVVNDPDTFHTIAEFGVAFLLFTLGLEFSLPKLVALRATVFGMGTLQMLICMGIFGPLIWLYGVPLNGVLITAAAISLSSTAIVSKELSRHNEINTRHGQIAIGILLFQDIAAVILLVIIPAVGSGAGSMEQLWSSLGWTGLKALGYFLAVVLIGKYVLPPLFSEISKIKSEELFVLSVLTVALSAAALAHALGLAMALGAFMAGMMLGESHFKHQIENEIRPFRDVLLGIFFVTIGFMIDLDMLVNYWPRILLFSFCLIAFKSILIFLLCLFLGDARTNALRAGIVLCQGGEFGFALIALGQKDASLPSDVAAFFVSIIVLSMIVTPFLVKRTGRIANAIFKERIVPQTSAYDLKKLESVELPQGELHHVVIAGYGRVGQIIARFLKQKDIPYVAIDEDALLVGNARDAGENVYYGNARQVSLLEKVGLEHAAMLIVSFDDHLVAEKLLHAVREKYRSLPVLVRTRDDSHLAELKEAGATEVIPEILEASIMIASHVMATLKVPRKDVTQLMKKVRRERYQMLKGYFEGEEVLAGEDFDASIPILRPVTLPQGAYAVGKLLAELAVAERQVVVEGVRRDEVTLAEGEVGALQSMDVLILNGTPSQLEAAEAYLLVGK